ncbi:serine hydrolase-like protein isoform X3 [Rhincodon typus]|uniref:serine hydrolase-like protein isoform X3 n=1 Tax=Rhincodon typus TaxID=259920 RepID=UPI00202F3DA0|nr:serine hydrolase-like protein isoform X3 [Rhincodon typus]
MPWERAGGFPFLVGRVLDTNLVEALEGECCGCDLNLSLQLVKEMSFLSKCFSTAVVKGMCRELNFTVPWGHIAAKAWGHPSGRPVLCLHGWADNANTFDRLIPLLPGEFYYVALDFPGHGLSSHRSPGIPYYFTEYISDVRRIADALNWNKFTILGHSMGGNVGGLFCSIFPELVDKLIVLDGYGFYPIASSAVQQQLQTAINELIKLEKEQGSPRVYTPDGALKRLLLGNKSVSEESGKILLQRGAIKVAEGLVFSRDLRINLATPIRITIEQCLEFQKNITAAVLLIIAKDGLWSTEKWNTNKPPFSLILDGYRNHLKEEMFQCIPGEGKGALATMGELGTIAMENGLVYSQNAKEYRKECHSSVSLLRSRVVLKTVHCLGNDCHKIRSLNYQ